LKRRRDLLEALDQLVQAVSRAGGSDEAQALLAQMEASGEGVLSELVGFCLRRADAAAADFLALCAVLANDPLVREQAREAAAELEGRGVSARSPLLPHLRDKRFLSGYVASVGRGRGHRLLTLWRRERGLAQAFLFSLDTEGALVGFEVSRNMTLTQAEELTSSGGVRVNRKQAAGLVRRGLEVARAKGLALPEEYLRQHRFIEEHIFGK
jgi:hypothetical protein